MEPFIGEIRLFPYNFVPVGWAACDGTLLQIRQFTPLFSLIGTIFGGDGQRTFALPNLKEQLPFPPGDKQGAYCIALTGVYPPRN